MNETTTTPPLPSGFARTARAFESLSDAEALPLIETAETNPDGEKRRVALSTLGRAGILPPLNWVPLARASKPETALDRMKEIRTVEREVVQRTHFDPEAERKARKVTTAPAGSDQDRGLATALETPGVPAPEIAVVAVTHGALGKCIPPRERHRYSPGGACLHCPARDPRKPLPKPSLADILKAEKATQSFPESVAVSPLPVPAPDSPQAGAVEEPETSAVPAIPTPAASIAATPITTAVSFAEAMGELEAVLSPTLSGDDGYAAWVVGKILDRQAQIQRVEAQAREMVAQLHNDLSGLAYRFKAPLQEYARRLIESSGRKGQRSVKLLSGTLGFSGGDGCAPVMSVADPVALHNWCLEQPDAEKFGAFAFVPDKQKVIAYAKATGEIPRGVEAKAKPEAFFVKSADGLSVNLSRLSAPALPAPDEEE